MLPITSLVIFVTSITIFKRIYKIKRNNTWEKIISVTHIPYGIIQKFNFCFIFNSAVFSKRKSNCN